MAPSADAGRDRWTFRHRRTLFFLLAILVGGGALVGSRLPVALFPQVSFPRVVVSIEAGDRPAEEMAALVTYPAEESLRAVPGVKSLRSTTSRGSAEISVNFAWGLDMVAATLQIQAAMAQVMPDLPPGTRADVRRMDPTVFPVIAYSLRSPLRSQTELYDIARYQIRPRLSVVDGVATVSVLGGAREEIHVTASADQLRRYGLTLDDLAQALSAANVVQAAGTVEDEYKLYLVLTDDRFTDLREIESTVLRSGGSGVVELGDVATVSRAPEPQRTVVNADGQRAVIFQVYQQRGGNTVRIARDIRETLAGIQSSLPDDVRIANWYDQSELINASATSVRDAVLVGVLLAMIVLFVFLRNARVTLIVTFVVPAVLAATSLLLWMLHQTLNLMTLGGMAAAVGLIIDDAIVMIEHITRRLEEHTARGADHAIDLLAAAREFTRPLVGSSAATIIVFAPLAFLSGVTGAFFRALSVTMASALLISFFVALTIVPLLSRRLLRDHASHADREGRILRAYRRVVGGGLRRPASLLLVILPILLAGYLAMRATGSGFMPATDEGGFILDYRAAPGTSLSETDRLLTQVEDILRNTPEVQTYSRRTGLQLGGGLTESNEGDYFIRLVPPPRRHIETVIDDVRSRVQAQVPGLEIEMAQLMEDLIGDLTAVPQPIEVQIFSDDGTLLQELAPKVADLIGTIPGVVDVNDGVVPAGDALVVRVDRVRTALEGIDPDLVARTIGDLVGGSVTTRVPKGEKMIDVRVWVPAETRDQVSDIARLPLQAPDGHRVPVGRVATVERVTGQPQINREDLKRMVAVTGRISGRDMGSTVRDVRARLDAPGVLPAGVYYRLGGLYEQQQIAFRGLMAVFVAAVALVFLVLLALYENVRVAIAMLLTTALAVAVVQVGLWLTGTERNISSMMGLTMIVGIVTEVSIFYYSEVIELRAIPDRLRRLVEAGANRARPIAMTTFAAILALLPLAFGLGHGSGMLQPLAIAIVAGLLAQLPLVLLVLPGLLVLLGVRPEEAGEPR
ncbi:MAG: efflux RND transporter permease subunit [bacterium]